MSDGGDRWFVRMPRALADPWLKLPAFTRALGRELYTTYERRVIGVPLAEVEDVLVRMLGPHPRERKAIRAAIRTLVDEGLLVAVEGGVRLLCWPDDWSAFRRSASQNGAARATTEGDRKVHRPSTDGDRKVHRPSTDGDRKVDGRCTDGAPTPPNNPAKTLNPDEQTRKRDQIERHTESARVGAGERERVRIHAREGAAEAELEHAVADLVEAPFEPDDRDAPPFGPGAELEPVREHLASVVPRRFRALHMAAFRLDPATTGASTLDFHDRLANTARKRGVEPLELLEQAFAAWAEQGRPGTDRASPYAAFVARFDRLVEPSARDARRGFMRSARAEDYEHGIDGDEAFG